jgi:hypothetical protein
MIAQIKAPPAARDLARRAGGADQPGDLIGGAHELSIHAADVAAMTGGLTAGPF